MAADLRGHRPHSALRLYRCQVEKESYQEIGGRLGVMVREHFEVVNYVSSNHIFLVYWLRIEVGVL